MIVLDENIFEDQRVRLRAWRIHVCKIGHDIGHKGMEDEEIIPFLRRMRRPTFVTWDRDFYQSKLCNDAYCVVYLDVRPIEVAEYTRRFLRHPEFKTWAQRKGCVIRVSPGGISAWRAGIARVSHHHWIAKG